MFLLIVLIWTREPPSMIHQRFAKVKTRNKRESLFANLITTLQEKLQPFSQKNAKSAEYISKSKKLLLQAGYASSEEDVIKYDAQKLARILIVGAFLFIYLITDFTTNALLICILALYVVYKLPEMKLKGEIKKRQKEFIKYLPDAMDLLGICVQAGLGLDSAFERVATEFKLTSAVVSGEFERLNKDILSGITREDAYKNLILRNNNPDLHSFVALLIQSDKLGTSVTQSLDAFCDSMRTKKRQRIEELTQQASTKMTIPMVLFMLPSIFIIIMYPAIQKIMVNLGGGIGGMTGGG